MKKLSLLLSVCLLFVLSSCSKKSTPSPNVTGTITVTIDGSVQKFNVSATANIKNIDGVNIVSIFGAQGTGSTNTIAISVVNPSITAGTTYTGVGSQVQISYTLASGAVYQYADDDGAAFATVLVKSVSSTNIQGTFSGNLNLISGTGAAKEILSNGTFNLNVVSAN
jgi:hypothetical protein